ncbi:hypothetical protein DRO66_02535 [Candidatus Bathyarchaeota archaeon]|nr:MAG: hypothetical protein DRO66_02535 [Candidatus Bathyarchaeota archaeon]
MEKIVFVQFEMLMSEMQIYLRLDDIASIRPAPVITMQSIMDASAVVLFSNPPVMVKGKSDYLMAKMQSHSSNVGIANCSVQFAPMKKNFDKGQNNE